MTSDKKPKGAAGSPEKADAPPAGPGFNIEWVSISSYDTDLSSNAYDENGVVTFGEGKLSFSESHPYGDEDNIRVPDPHWRKSAERLLGGALPK